MFKGYINNEEYTDANLYYKALDETQKSGQPFTASASYSTENWDKKETSEEKPCNCTDSKCVSKKSVAYNFEDIVDELETLDVLYKNYIVTENKKDWVESLKSYTPYNLSNRMEESIEALTPEEYSKLKTILTHRINSASDERAYYNQKINNIDKYYQELDAQRTKAYELLKHLNSQIEDLAKERQKIDDCLVMLDYIDSVNKSFDEILPKSLDLSCANEKVKTIPTPAQSKEKASANNVDELKDKIKNGETITLGDLLEGFKSMYNKYLA